MRKRVAVAIFASPAASVMSTRLFFAIACLLTVSAAETSAQAVRGRVYEPARAGVIPGAIITLVDSAGITRASALSDATGGFFLNAGLPGIFALQVDRIGYERGYSQPFLLEPGDTISVSFEARIAPVALEAVESASDRVCRMAPEASANINRLWSEARKTLDVALRTERSAVAPRFEYTRHVRELDENAELLVREVSRQVVRAVGSPYRAAPIETLEAEGFANDTLVFLPTSEVLLSDFFLETHCLSIDVATGTDSIGIRFQPIPARRSVPEIAGTFWLGRDGGLHRVELGYVNVSPRLAIWPPRATIEYRSLADGRVVIDRWAARAPLMTERQQPSARGGATTSSFAMLGVREEGGALQSVVDALGRPIMARRLASLGGTVFDSTTMAPLANALVYVSGTSLRATTGSDGFYLMPQVPPGNYQLAISHPRFDSLQVAVAPIPTDIGDEPVHSTIDIHVPPAAPAVLAALEAARRGDNAAPMVRLVGRVVDDSTSTPVAGATVQLGDGATIATDERGRFALPVTPGDDTLRVEHVAYGTLRQSITIADSPRMLEVRMTPNAIALRSIDVEVRANRGSEMRLVGSPGRVINEAVIADHAKRGAQLADLLQSRMPGLRVRVGHFRTREHDGRYMMCVESTRGPTEINERIVAATHIPFCDMIEVYIDGVRIPSAGDYLYNMGLNDFAELEYLSGAQGGWRYGHNAGHSGVLLLRTKRGQ